MEDIMKYYTYSKDFVKFWCNCSGIQPYETRDRLCRFNSRLSFYIFNEKEGRHNRLHFHAMINNEKVASIFLDNDEIDFMHSRIKSSDKKKIKEWLEKNVEFLRGIHLNENGQFEIPFNQLIY